MRPAKAYCSGTPTASHTARAARAFWTLNRPGMVSRNSRLYRGVFTRNRMSPPAFRTWEPKMVAEGSVWEKVMMRGQLFRAASSTRSAWSQSRFTQAAAAWAKMRSLEAK